MVRKISIVSGGIGLLRAANANRWAALAQQHKEQKMEGRQLAQYIIDTSDVVLAKKQEATEYLAKLESADALDGELPCPTCKGEVGHRINCPHGIAFSSPPSIEKL
jgi:hypothetical protein